uniref:Chitin-binding type-2 domain-containing protein n=1 Tax=Rhabditophanes sp. KR3021 TaxID=114890 RepID=A0AC35TGA4_9BILA
MPPSLVPSSLGNLKSFYQTSRQHLQSHGGLQIERDEVDVGDTTRGGEVVTSSEGKDGLKMLGSTGGVFRDSSMEPVVRTTTFSPQGTTFKETESKGGGKAGSDSIRNIDITTTTILIPTSGNLTIVSKNEASLNIAPNTTLSLAEKVTTQPSKKKSYKNVTKASLKFSKRHHEEPPYTSRLRQRNNPVETNVDVPGEINLKAADINNVEFKSRPDYHARQYMNGQGDVSETTTKKGWSGGNTETTIVIILITLSIIIIGTSSIYWFCGWKRTKDKKRRVAKSKGKKKKSSKKKSSRSKRKAGSSSKRKSSKSKRKSKKSKRGASSSKRSSKSGGLIKDAAKSSFRPSTSSIVVPLSDVPLKGNTTSDAAFDYRNLAVKDIPTMYGNFLPTTPLTDGTILVDPARVNTMAIRPCDPTSNYSIRVPHKCHCTCQPPKPEQFIYCTYGNNNWYKPRDDEIISNFSFNINSTYSIEEPFDKP